MSTINVDKAWENLFNRLDQENLIPPEKKGNKNPRIFRWAAVAVVLLGFAGAAFYLALQPKDGTGKLLSKTNDDTENTLVTTLEDGSTVYLSGHSSLFYPESFAPDKRKVKMEGNALFDIHSESGRPFLVETKHISVQVLGTAFRIMTTGNDEAFELFVQRGKVKVINKYNKEAVIAEAGEMVRLESNRLFKKKNNDLEMFMTFTQKMHFKDERLDNILKVIQNTTGTGIFLMDKNLGDRTLTVTFDNNTVDSMIELICIALNLDHIQKQDGIYISSF